MIEVERKVPRGQSWTVPRGAVHARDSREDNESDDNIHTKTKKEPQTSSRSSELVVVEKKKTIRLQNKRGQDPKKIKE